MNEASITNESAFAARQPVIHHVSSTIRGLWTIRAFLGEDQHLRDFDAHQDRHTAVSYLQLAAVRWFTLRLDILSVLFVGLLAFVAVATKWGESSYERRVFSSVSFATIQLSTKDFLACVWSTRSTLWAFFSIPCASPRNFFRRFVSSEHNMFTMYKVTVNVNVKVNVKVTVNVDVQVNVKVNVKANVCLRSTTKCAMISTVIRCTYCAMQWFP